MCEKRQSNLRKLVSKPPRPIQTVTPEPGVPLQPPVGAPTPHMINFNRILKKANTVASVSLCVLCPYLTQKVPIQTVKY